MNFQGRYEDTDNGEIIKVIGTEDDGIVRVRYLDDTEDVMPKAVLDYQFTEVDEDDFDDDPEDEWTAEDEARVQRSIARRQRLIDENHAAADLRWLKRYGQQMPGCGCPDLTEEELAEKLASLC